MVEESLSIQSGDHLGWTNDIGVVSYDFVQNASITGLYNKPVAEDGGFLIPEVGESYDFGGCILYPAVFSIGAEVSYGKYKMNCLWSDLVMINLFVPWHCELCIYGGPRVKPSDWLFYSCC